MPLEYVQISSRYGRPRSCLDRERILFRRLKRKRNHKKRHGVNKDKSEIDRRKAAEAKESRNAHAERAQAFHAQARAYWTGTADVHP
jgi:hypothetical protein